MLQSLIAHFQPTHVHNLGKGERYTMSVLDSLYLPETPSTANRPEGVKTRGRMVLYELS